MKFLTASVDVKVDDSKLPSQLAKVKSAVTRTVDKIKSSFGKMATSFKAAWSKMASSVKIAGAAIVAGLVLATKAAMKQEDAQFLLAAALKISGEWTKELQKDFEAFAASIQRATIYGDEEVLSLMQLQKSLGVSASKLKEAAKQAIGLATATGRDIRSMSMYIALAQQGEFTMLRRYIPALRSTTDETEQLKIITEFAAAGFKLAEERAKTTSGALRQMWNALGDVAEKLGMSLLPAIKDLGKGLTEAVQKGGAFQEFIQEQVEGLAALVAGIELLDKKLKGLGEPKVSLPGRLPIYQLKEWYMEKPEERIPKALESAKKAGILPPIWMISYAERAKEANALTKAAEKYHEIEISMMGERKAQAIKDALDSLRRMDKEVEMSVDASLKKVEAEDVSVKKIAEIDTKMRLEQEARAYHAMRAPILAAEEAAKESAERHKRIAEDIAISMSNSFSNAFDQMMFEGKRFWDTMRDMARELLRTIVQIIMYKTIAEPLAYGIMGLPVPGAQAGGFVREGGLAKIHTGETIVSAGGQGFNPNVTVNIMNPPGTQFDAETEQSADVDGYVVNIMLKDLNERNGPFSQALQSKFGKR